MAWGLIVGARGSVAGPARASAGFLKAIVLGAGRSTLRT
jgi:hypothetical protein